MREEHPIDERFKALYDAEAAPPDAVRAALSSRMGWGQSGPTNTTWRPMLFAASAFLVVGAAVALWLLREPEPAPLVQLQPVEKAPEPPAQPEAARGDNASQVHTDPYASAKTHASDAAAGTNARSTQPAPKAATAQTVNGTPTEAHRQQNRSVAHEEYPATAEDGIGQTTTRKTLPPRIGSSAAGNVGRSSTEPTSFKALRAAASSHPSDPNSEAGSAAAASSFYAERFRTEDQPEYLAAIPQPHIEAAVGSPVGRNPAAGYVLPRGNWWIGPYTGVGSVRGQWKGAGSSDLSAAETWRSTAQVGIVGGRQWRSGWSVATGLGVARVRSTFNHEGAGAPEAFTEVDTAWVEHVYSVDATSIPVYTWTIDSMVGMRPGSVLRSDARNFYTAIQVPILLAWHGGVRRLHYGAFGGVTAWIPTQRKGLTLVQATPDAGFSVTKLDDARVNERFGAQLHGQIGLSLGLSLIEDLSAFAEPMISTPLVSLGGADAPWLTRPMLQIRLQYDLRSKYR